MTRKKKLRGPAEKSELRISPDKRLVEKFDARSMAEFPIASENEMGFRVMDDCAEEHIM